MRRKPALLLFAALAAALLLFGCKSGPSGDGSPQARYETTTLTISAGDAAASGLAERAIFLGSFADVTSVTIEVAGEDKFGVLQNPLATATLTQDGSGVWRGTIPDLPIGPLLTFTAHGYDASATEIFNGVATQMLTGSGDSVTVAMDPADNTVPIVFPIITGITRPAEIERSTDAPVTVSVQGNASETLNFAFTSGGGGFAPLAGTIPLPSGGTGTINATYSAPAAVGTYPHSVRVTNSQGNAVETDFDTTVVYAVTTADVQTGFAPVVTALLGKRTGNDVTWTATVTDDGPLAALTYAWSFAQSGGTAGAAFSVAGANPGVMAGYDQTVTGEITLTVTDGDTLETSVTFILVPGQFPDDLVGTPPIVPPSFAYVAAAGGVNDLTVIDTVTNTEDISVSLTFAPFALALSPDGQFLYITGLNDDLVAVMDTATRSVVDTIAVGDAPRDLAFLPDGSRVYVVNQLSQNISVIDTASHAIVATIPLPSFAQGIAITPDGSKAYVGTTSAHSVEVISTATNSVTASIYVGGVSASPAGMAVSPDGSLVYAAGSNGANVIVISTATDAILGTVPTGTSPHKVAFSPDGSQAYVTNYQTDNVTVIDVASSAVLDTIAVGNHPYGVAFKADGTAVYVANSGLSATGNSVSVIDPATRSVVATVTVWGPQGIVTSP